MIEPPGTVDRPLRTSWRVERLIGTIMMVAAPLTSRHEDLDLGVVALLGVSLSSWLVFAVADSRAPTAAVTGLGLSSLTAAATTGMTTDSTAVLMVCVALAAFSMHTVPGSLTIIGVTAMSATVSMGTGLWRDRPTAELFGDTAVMLMVVVLGLSRRQYRTRAEHIQALLKHTRQAQREQARAAALDERTRIARELHDVLAHSLGALTVQLEVADALLSEHGDLDGARQRVRQSRRLAVEGLAEARNAVAALRGEVPPLRAALAQLAAVYQRDHGLRVEIRVEGEPRTLSPATAVCLLRTAREALTNVARHAPGTWVTVVLGYHVHSTRLAVCNGPGTPREEAEALCGDPDAASGSPSHEVSGYGLIGMRERIALLNGTLVAVATAGDAGWQVIAEIPEPTASVPHQAEPGG